MNTYVRNWIHKDEYDFAHAHKVTHSLMEETYKKNPKLIWEAFQEF